MKIVEEECDESIYWMELLMAGRAVDPKQLTELLKQANEILSMTVASVKTARLSK
jgi:four helix bundle protein